MPETTIVCHSCDYALLEGAEIPAHWCGGCPRFVAVEEPYLIPEEDIYGTDPQGERQWRIDQDHAEALAMERTEFELDAYQPSQQSPEREPMRQRVNGWPGRKVRKAKGRRNG